MNTQRGFASILIILLGLVAVGGGVYYLSINNNIPETVLNNSEIVDNESSNLSEDWVETDNVIDTVVQITQQTTQPANSSTCKLSSEMQSLLIMIALGFS